MNEFEKKKIEMHFFRIIRHFPDSVSSPVSHSLLMNQMELPQRCGTVSKQHRTVESYIKATAIKLSGRCLEKKRTRSDREKEEMRVGGAESRERPQES